jgi:hypothetical protein
MAPSVIDRTHKLGPMGAVGLQRGQEVDSDVGRFDRDPILDPPDRRPRRQLRPAGVIAAVWPARGAANLDVLAVPETL